MFILRTLLPFKARGFSFVDESVICAQHKAEGTNDTGGWQIKIQGNVIMNIIIIIVANTKRL